MSKKLLQILKIGENETVEFKASFNEEVIISLVSFSNAKGGIVYVGVGDDGKINGLRIEKETVAQWINEIKNKTAPAIIPDAEEVELNGKKIVTLSVQEYPVKPISFRGKYYKRIKNANHQMLVSEVVNMHLQSLNTSWDAYPDQMHDLDDLSLDKVQRSMDLLKKRGFTIIETPLTFLMKNDLVREGKPTHAAYLLFKNKDSISTTIELGRFQDPITIKDTSRSQSDIITQVDAVMDFVKKHMNVALILTGEVENRQKWQYPLEAIREIVLNMIIHRDYRSNSDSVVKIFDSKIEFYNPGRLPENITIQDLIENKYKSTPRNKAIAEFFKNSGWIEKYGSGIGRIINYFKEVNLPLPTFENHSGGFLVTVFATNNEESPQNVTKNVTENVTKNVTEKRMAKLIEILAADNKLTTELLAQKLDVTKRTILRDLGKLKKIGHIKYIGSAKGGHWEVTKG